METIIERAIKIAGKYHANDQWGEYPYVVHLALVAEQAGGNLAPLAFLHDVYEDHPDCLQELEKNFPKKLVEQIKLISRDRSISYFNYIQKIRDSGDAEVIKVKISDLKVNFYNNPPARLKERYIKALRMLEA